MENSPAFPIVGQWGVSERGMTLRDYFAAKAMQGVLSSDKLQTFNFQKIANDSYLMADAMLEARK
jgi:hypothetical protein